VIFLQEIIGKLAVLFCLSALVLIPSVAAADMQFMPRIIKSEAEAGIDMSYESNKNSVTGGGGLDTTDTFFAENITLSTTGFIYDPRFILFLAKVTGGSAQEMFKLVPGNEDNSWHTYLLKEYEFRAVILPEHPYNLEIYAIRRNPFIHGRLSPGISLVTYDNGAIFKYKRMPYAATARYAMTTLESERSTTHNKTLNVSGGYFKDWGTTALTLTHSNADSTTNGVPINFTNDDYSLENQIRFFKQKAYLTTNVAQNKVTQSSIIQDFHDKRLTWTEQLNLDLPWNFSSSIYYNYYKENSKSHTTEPVLESDLNTKSNTGGLTVSNRVYKSLLTTYNFNYIDSTSQTGKFRVISNSLSSNYVKTIPVGKVLANFTIGKSDLEQTGSPSIINETHNAPLFGEFSLERGDIDESTLLIRVKTPDTGLLIDLQRGVHYQLFQVGNSFLVDIIGIPADALSSDPLFVYEFQVTYDIAAQNAKISTTNFGYSLRLELFHNLVNPYYSYFHTSQDVISGTILGGPENTSTNTVGISFEKPSYVFLVEYEDVQSNIRPSKRYRAELNYHKNITLTTNLLGRLYRTKTEYPEVPGEIQGISFNNTITGVDVRVRKTYPRKKVNIYAGGSYSRRTGFFTTTTYSLNSLLTWKIGKIDLTAGLELGRAETQLDTGKEEQTHQYYYLSVRRKLF
jgi:hypothetical protein